MSLNDYTTIVSALTLGNVAASVIETAWRLDVPPEEFCDWLDFGVIRVSPVAL